MSFDPQVVLGSNVRFPATITARTCVAPTPTDAAEGPDGDVRYSAKISGGLPYQVSGASVNSALPSGGRPGTGVMIKYAKVGEPCDIFIPASGPPQLIVMTESILFEDCASSTPVPGDFVIERAVGVNDARV